MTKHTPTPWQLAARKYEERHHDGRPAAVVLPVPVVREEGCLMDKSTPRPWHTEGSVVADYGYNPIAQMRQPAGQTEIDNAALIVRAVNSHDALLDCTKLLEKTILYEMKRRKHEGDDEGVNLLKMSLHQARAALALATK